MEIKKYPRTAHVEGSRLQKGDEDLSQVRFADIEELSLTIEEKIDGANAGISFDNDGKLLLQSRGHFLTGGPRERHWNLFKTWAACHEDAFFNILEDRYVVYGEWMFAKHTVFYDLLPHYFLEFDVYDRLNDVYLSTPARKRLLKELPISSVLVLHKGKIKQDAMERLVRPSYFKTGNWREKLCVEANHALVDPELAYKQTDHSDLMEGLYIKIEEEDRVIQRLKWVRNSFNNAIADSETHWLDRPIIQNVLAPGIDIFSPYK